ncbi:hypothetical protein [Streptomyces sp. MBT27]|uniref:hypothetical protein n=1 Tax=Streptomyces sp. MBT27 TaxID=1488356 RepID=UPI0014209C25|nr:hypothetical protein [Streptomyces sp. MBT27]
MEHLHEASAIRHGAHHQIALVIESHGAVIPAGFGYDLLLEGVQQTSENRPDDRRDRGDLVGNLTELSLNVLMSLRPKIVDGSPDPHPFPRFEVHDAAAAEISIIAIRTAEQIMTG